MDEYVRKEVHDEFARRIEDEENRQNHRLTILEDKIGNLSELTASVKVLASNMERMVKEQEKISTRLDAIEAEPAENWKKAVWLIVAAAIGFGVHALFGI